MLIRDMYEHGQATAAVVLLAYVNGGMMMLDRLRNLRPDGLDLDELLAVSALADGLEEQYNYYDLDHPRWFTEARDDLNTEIKARIRGQNLKRKAEIESRLEALKTPSQKKTDLRRELDAVNKKLSA